MICDYLGYGEKSLEFIGRQKDYLEFIRSTLKSSEQSTCDLNGFEYKQNSIDCLPDIAIAGAECPESAQVISEVFNPHSVRI